MSFAGFNTRRCNTGLDAPEGTGASACQKCACNQKGREALVAPERFLSALWANRTATPRPRPDRSRRMKMT
jgi:hypothetical protein